MTLSYWTNVLLQGVFTGGLYALFAAGLALSFGVMRQVNLAHGDMIVLGGFAVLGLASALSGLLGNDALTPWIALVLLLPAMALGGYGLQRGLLNRTVGRDFLAPVMVTFGLSIVLQNAMMAAFSANVRQIDTGALATGTWVIGDVALGWLPLTILAIAVAALLGLQWLFSATRLGRALRAVSDDPETAQLMGLRPRHLYGAAMAISCVLVTLAGALMMMRTAVGPFDGPQRLLFAFEAVIMGGMGSLWGALLGGVLLGIAQALGAEWDPGLGVLCGHLLFLFVLLIRPQGLFPRMRER